MRTVGVDLAAQATHTAVAVVEWRLGGARLVEVEIPATDDVVLRQSARADKVGIDCPLGWPEPFVDFLRAHRAGMATNVPEWRSLAYRRTDEYVRATAGLVPLSVATDRIGLTAIRAARLQARLACDGHDTRRDGSGLITEVYPAAALKHWGLPHRQYKGRMNHGALGGLVDALVAAAPWLDLREHEPMCRLRDHAFDALVCALLARAAACGLASVPEATEREVALAEGWIALPLGALEELAR